MLLAELDIDACQQPVNSAREGKYLMKMCDRPGRNKVMFNVTLSVSLRCERWSVSLLKTKTWHPGLCRSYWGGGKLKKLSGSPDDAPQKFPGVHERLQRDYDNRILIITGLIHSCLETMTTVKTMRLQTLDYTSNRTGKVGKPSPAVSLRSGNDVRAEEVHYNREHNLMCILNT